MKRLLPLIAITCTLIACQKKNPEPEYVRGEVLTGIKGNVPIDSVFAVFNRLGLQIKRVQNFTYSAPYAATKLDSISAYLNTKPYVDSVNWKVHFSYNMRWNQPVYFSTFFNMDAANQADWLYTINLLQLTDVHDTFASAYLAVPPGTEKYWTDQLRGNSIIKWAELNYVVNIEL